MDFIRLNPDLVRVLHAAYNSQGQRTFTPTVGFRAIGADPIKAAQLVDWEVTRLLLNSGPTTDVDTGVLIFPVRNVEKRLIKIAKLGSNALLPSKTKRPYGAPHVKTTPRTMGQPVELEYHGRAGWIDARQLENQSTSFPDLQLVATRQAQDETLRGLDKVKADMVADVDNYDIVSVGGDWSGDGTMLEQVNAVAENITQNTGAPKNRLTLTLFNTTFNVAQRDALFQDKRKNTAGAADPTLADLQAYLGVGEVRHISQTYQQEEGGPISYMYPTGAVLSYNGNPQLMAPPEMGDRAWGFTFRIPGVASTPWYDNDTTTWFFPYDLCEHTEILDPGCAGLITSPT